MDELFIDNERCDLTDTGIALEYKGNVFGELDKIESSYSFTVKMPKTGNNLRIVQAAGIVSNESGWPFLSHRGQVLRDGVVIVDNAVVYLEGVTAEAINVCLSFGSAVGYIFDAVKESMLSSLNFGNSPIPWGDAGEISGNPRYYPLAEFGLKKEDAGYTPPVIYVSGSSEYDTPDNILKALFDGPLGNLKIDVSDITRLYQRTQNWVVPLLSRSENPAISDASRFTSKWWDPEGIEPVLFQAEIGHVLGWITVNGQRGQLNWFYFGEVGGVLQSRISKYAGAMFAPFNNQTQDKGYVYGFQLNKEQTEIYMKMSGKMWLDANFYNGHEVPSTISICVMKCRVRLDNWLVYEVYSYENVSSLPSSYAEDGEDGGKRYIFEFDNAELGPFSGPDLEMDGTRDNVIYMFYVGYSDGTPLIYQPAPKPQAAINVPVNSGGTLDVQFFAEEISPTTYLAGGGKTTGNFYAAPNMPEISQLDFFKSILAMAGLVPIGDRTALGLRLVPLSEIIANTEDWSDRLAEEVPEVGYSVSQYAKRNLFKFSEPNEADGEVPSQDGEIVQRAPMADDDTDIIELPFTASLDLKNRAYAKVYSYDTSTEDNKVVEMLDFEARGDEPVIWEVGDNNTAHASLGWPRLITERYAELSAILDKPATVKVKVRLSAVDLQGLRFDRAKYIRQLGSHFILDSLRTQSGSDICTATLVRVPVKI